MSFIDEETAREVAALRKAAPSTKAGREAQKKFDKDKAAAHKAAVANAAKSKGGGE